MDIDPKPLGLLWPGIVQEAQYSDNHYQHEHEPVKGNGAGSVAVVGL